MTLHDLFRTARAWPAQMLAVALVAALPVAARAGIAATATITPTQVNGTTFNYAISVTNTGTTTIGTFWFAWIPGEGFMTVMPTNIKSPAGWTDEITNGVGSIQYVTSSLLQPGDTLSGFSFDSTMTPAQLAAMSGGYPVDVSYVYIDDPLADPGFKVLPTIINPLPPSPAVSSVLPGGRSVEVGATATVFATMLNGSTTAALTGCTIGLPSTAPASLAISYQTTNPATNAPTGTPNTPVTIPAGGAQTFVLSFTSSAAVTAPGLDLQFDCAAVQPVVSIPGVNTVDLLFSTTPIADVIALSATATNNGILEVPANGASAFAVATDNAGATGTLTVTADTGSATLPLSISVCQTNPANGACLAAPAASVTLSDTAGATPTFSVFATATGTIPLDAATSRIFLRFTDSNGTSHGSTSVAVETT
jgi:hypothetical protein